MAATTTIAASVKDLTHSIQPLSRLINFFAKYPPSLYSSLSTGQAIPTKRQRQEMGAKPLSSTKVPQAKSIPAPSAAKDVDPATVPLTVDEFGKMTPTLTLAEEQARRIDGKREQAMAFPPNPFLPYKNPETGRWRGARIGLRQQADLFKYARACGVEELLPPSVKSTFYKQQRVLERGLAVKGTGEGQQVKGHKWERQRVSTLEKRKKAMEEMPALIREWEGLLHGKKWKKYPREKSA